MKRLIRILGVAIFILLGLWFILFTPVDRSPYRESTFYIEMDQRLDSLETSYRNDSIVADLYSGWSKVSITPSGKAPLAGYANRSPKWMSEVHDSIFVRTVVFKLGSGKVALVTADLLIFHPEVTQAIQSNLPPGWSSSELYLTTTHTHSSLGGWAPGIVGEAIAGEQNDTTAIFIATSVSEGIKKAEEQMTISQIGLIEKELPQLVHNRLIQEKGAIDPWLKSLIIQRNESTGIMNFFSAHATCLNSRWQSMSGDFPGLLNKLLSKDSIYDFAAYGAGAVGSMGPVADGEGWERVNSITSQLREEMDLYPLIVQPKGISNITSFQLAVPLRDPYVKITTDWAIRPYLFKMLAGDYPINISVLKLDNTVLIGVPADFSGELALPLYEKARVMGLNLIITSFSGQYIGYVVKDEWYDLEKYESRSMSWYGPDNGAYLSEIIERILQIVA